jgi:hypothetical protein
MAEFHVRGCEPAFEQLGWDSIRVELEHELEVDRMARELRANVRDAVREGAHGKHEHGVDKRIDLHDFPARTRPAERAQST